MQRNCIIHCWWEWRMLQPLLEKTVWQFLIRRNMQLPEDPPILPLHIYPIEMKTYSYTNLYMNANSGFISQKLDTTQIPFYSWVIKQMTVSIYPYLRILLRTQRNKLLIPAETWMNLQRIMLSVKSHSQNITFCMMPFI